MGGGGKRSTKVGRKREEGGEKRKGGADTL